MRQGVLLLIAFAFLFIHPAWALEPPFLVSPEPFSTATNPQSDSEGIDTLWFGGDDGNGFAVPDGVWDWETPSPSGDPFQGWTSRDYWENPAICFHRVTAQDFIEHGDPCVPMFPETVGMLWCGMHEDEALAEDFPGGMGYRNYMNQKTLSPVLPFNATQDALNVEFLYFCDMEDGYDFSRVIVLCRDASGATIDEYELASFTGIDGAPSSPALFSVLVPAGTLDPLTASIRLEFRVWADGGWSDEDGYYDSSCGPFAADDVEITIGAVQYAYGFETGAEGWEFQKDPGEPEFMAVVDEQSWTLWVEEAGVPSCTLSGNALCFADIENSPYYPPGLPYDHWETSWSGRVARRGDPYSVLLTLDYYRHPSVNYRIAYTYYPYTSEINPEPHWSGVQADTWMFWSSPACGPFVWDYYDPSVGPRLPAYWDSLRVAYQAGCAHPAGCESHGAPILDNVRVGLVVEGGSVDNGEQFASTALDPIAAFAATAGAQLHYRLGDASAVTLTVVDASGRQVRALFEGALAAGEHVAWWDARDDGGRPVEAGVYWVRMTTSSGFETARRAVLLR